MLPDDVVEAYEPSEILEMRTLFGLLLNFLNIAVEAYEPSETLRMSSLLDPSAGGTPWDNIPQNGLLETTIYGMNPSR